MRILCVDDDPAILVILDAALSLVGGHEVKTASSGEAALSEYLSKEDEFDCLLFDIQMPGMLGVELCHEVRKMSAYDKVPIIMLTAMQDHADSHAGSGLH